jgi:hypothetical protein
VNALFLAEIDDFLLGKQRVVFDLVGCGCDGCLCQELFKVLDGVVGDANGFDFVGVCLDELLEALPGVNVSDAMVDITGAVFELGEQRVVSWLLLV